MFAPMPVMPENLKDKMTAAQWDFAAPIFARSKGAVRVRASRPTKASGSSQYIWRMVSFIVSTNPQHHCMPIGADFYIGDTEYSHRTDKYVPKYNYESDYETVKKWDDQTWARMHRGACRNNYIKEELDPIVDIIVDNIPKEKWLGAKRWKTAIYG